MLHVIFNILQNHLIVQTMKFNIKIYIRSLSELSVSVKRLFFKCLVTAGHFVRSMRQI